MQATHDYNLDPNWFSTQPDQKIVCSCTACLEYADVYAKKVVCGNQT